MADYKLSELNSIDTIRSDDLLHVRVKKRPEMLGDEDRRMTYQDFLASFKLERFVQIAGSTMTGDLGIVKLLYGGKAVFDPTGSSEITMGDVLKTFKINANGLKLTIADASRSATVYHTLNKPSPNELGMRTNAENDARYARLEVLNTFKSRQTIVADGQALLLRSATDSPSLYVRGQDPSGTNKWYVGFNTSNVLGLSNEASGTTLTLDSAGINSNKNLNITGQVKPSDWSNLDDRYFTQTLANQRFAQLAGNNTFNGTNTFKQLSVFKKDGEAIRLQNANAAQPLYIKAIDSTGVNRWYIGNSNEGDNVALENYKTSGKITVGTSVNINKTLTVTGQVQPSDWTNIDSRYIPAATLSTLAKINAKNTFSQGQIIKADGEGIRLQGVNDTGGLFLQGYTSDGAKKWFMGTNASGNFTIREMVLGTELSLRENYIQFNKNVTITGQVQPSDWTNLDKRYYTGSASNARYMYAGKTGEGDNDAAIAWDAKTGLYNVKTGATSSNLLLQLYQGSESSTPSAQLRFKWANGGMWYRTSRDGDGFEKSWAMVYTTAQKPTPSAIGAYTKAETDQKIAQAVSDSTDLNKIYPVGIVTWFNSNVNPNTALPGLTWTYLNNGVGRTIRIAAANGSDVATTGGSDSVTLSVGNLPSHTHSFSATTSSFDYGTKNTNTTGAHTHSVSGSTSSAGNHSHSISWIGQNSQHYSGGGGGYIGTGPGYTDANGAHTHSVSGTAASAGNHAHSVGIGAHSHTVSGNTGGTGSGSAFSVTNQFYKLMAWVRTA
ncbi:tail fibers protein [Escherichia phage pinkbiff]|uniref:Tail fibers protein n=1 Tax=Escherichia phage pinkbiff TaxID=2696440 RepID=A0A6B9WZH6_9CAUD|nr:tail fibers protein [Escherichia phage pinkbiff]